MKKMKRFLYVVAVLSSMIGLSACSKQSTDQEGGVTTQQEAVVVQQTTYEKEGTKFVFFKNRLTRTADIEMTHTVSDADEFTDFMGEQVTMAPLLINMLCGVMNQAFFDSEIATDSAEKSEEAADNLKADAELKNNLEGYTVHQYQLNFIDAETQEPIASCQAQEKGFDKIIFTVNRDYSSYGSFLGVKIGQTE